MIVILRSDADESAVENVIQAIESLGQTAHPSRGTHRTIIGVIGDEDPAIESKLRAVAGVQDVLRVLPPYKLASRDAHPQDSIVDVSGVPVGGGNLAMIAGPCSVENAERMDLLAAIARKAGANLLRGGAYKPRTSPYAFQGLGVDGLKILRDAGKKHGMPVVTEITDPRNVDVVAEHADVLQVGARNMQNFVLLTEIGQTNKPVLLKRGMSATVTDLLMSAEYVLSQGNPNVILCERGIKGFDPATRNVFDVAAVPLVKSLCHLPIIVDPSHATGKPNLIPACSMAGLAAGADGVHVEIHDCPSEAMSDGPQALLPDQYSELMQQLSQLATLLGKSTTQVACSGEPAGVPS